jgi:hypothetical protein
LGNTAVKDEEEFCAELPGIIARRAHRRPNSTFILRPVNRQS